jgi:hypothetical protein
MAAAKWIDYGCQVLKAMGCKSRPKPPSSNCEKECKKVAA